MGIFTIFKEKILLPREAAAEVEGGDQRTDNLIALGVLLWAVAQADDNFLPREMEKIKAVLNEYAHIDPEDMPIVLRAIKEASIERIDLHQFVSEASLGMDRGQRAAVIENLFRIACSDRAIDSQEEAVIRQSSGLLGLDHKEFIEAKIKVKAEYGL